jgi:hypothetical protein
MSSLEVEKKAIARGSRKTHNYQYIALFDQLREVAEGSFGMGV